MNREAKFRGLKVQGDGIVTDEFVYGYYSGPATIGYFIKTQSGVIREFKKVAVDPKTISQFTGFKDKNDKDIYDNSACLFHCDSDYCEYCHETDCAWESIVKWDNDEGCYMVNGERLCSDNNFLIEII